MHTTDPNQEIENHLDWLSEWYLQNLFDLTKISQYTQDYKTCQIESIVDFMFLFPGIKVRKKDKLLTIDVHKFEIRQMMYGDTSELDSFMGDDKGSDINNRQFEL